MSQACVSFESVVFRYPDGTEALKGVQLNLRPGECVGLIGANASGKSTLLAHINGLLLPTRGHVRVGGLPVTAPNMAQIRRMVGLVLQDPGSQLFMPTVLEDVAFGPLNLGFETVQAEALALRALESVGAGDLLTRPPQRLSQGERSRVALAAVLAMDPDILALDEPSARLDLRARGRLISLLKARPGTKLIAGHDLDLIWELCDRVLILDRGRLAVDGPTALVLSNEPLLRSHGLELPLGLRLPRNDGAGAQKEVPTFVWNRN